MVMICYNYQILLNGKSNSSRPPVFDGKSPPNYGKISGELLIWIYHQYWLAMIDNCCSNGYLKMGNDDSRRLVHDA